MIVYYTMCVFQIVVFSKLENVWIPKFGNC